MITRIISFSLILAFLLTTLCTSSYAQESNYVYKTDFGDNTDDEEELDDVDGEEELVEGGKEGVILREKRKGKKKKKKTTSSSTVQQEQPQIQINEAPQVPEVKLGPGGKPLPPPCETPTCTVQDPVLPGSICNNDCPMGSGWHCQGRHDWTTHVLYAVCVPD